MIQIYDIWTFRLWTYIATGFSGNFAGRFSDQFPDIVSMFSTRRVKQHFMYKPFIPRCKKRILAILFYTIPHTKIQRQGLSTELNSNYAGPHATITYNTNIHYNKKSTLIWTTQQHERVDKLNRGRVE